ncbi:CAP-Gly domain-containing linker protein 2-like [Liolophura sinensis]|uniref:CAP-Gly domain-containing linker protein 2-like n=1 Tax=Liolophura sinensis TaxID=3198878 RepID=UPI0031583684
MVLFVNVNLGQRVDVYLWDNIYTGTVRYKGCLNSLKGEWVGVELDKAVGTHSGMIKGRRYFQCTDKHGVFVRASRLRFKPIRRYLYNTYHTKERESSCEETLFTRTIPEVKNGPYDPVSISDIYNGNAKNMFEDSGNVFGPRRAFPLRHSVSNSIPAATMLRPRSAALTYTSRPVHNQYSLEDDGFISSPSIPKTHMPFSALHRQVKRGWDGAHYTREMSVHNGRDVMKFNQWNDISE